MYLKLKYRSYYSIEKFFSSEYSDMITESLVTFKYVFDQIISNFVTNKAR